MGENMKDNNQNNIADTISNIAKESSAIDYDKENAKNSDNTLNNENISANVQPQQPAEESVNVSDNNVSNDSSKEYDNISASIIDFSNAVKDISPEDISAIDEYNNSNNYENNIINEFDNYSVSVQDIKIDGEDPENIIPFVIATLSNVGADQKEIEQSINEIREGKIPEKIQKKLDKTKDMIDQATFEELANVNSKEEAEAVIAHSKKLKDNVNIKNDYIDDISVKNFNNTQIKGVLREARGFELFKNSMRSKYAFDIKEPSFKNIAEVLAPGAFQAYSKVVGFDIGTEDLLTGELIKKIRDNYIEKTKDMSFQERIDYTKNELNRIDKITKSKFGDNSFLESLYVNSMLEDEGIASRIFDDTASVFTSLGLLHILKKVSKGKGSRLIKSEQKDADNLAYDTFKESENIVDITDKHNPEASKILRYSAIDSDGNANMLANTTKTKILEDTTPIQKDDSIKTDTPDLKTEILKNRIKEIEKENEIVNDVNKIIDNNISLQITKDELKMSENAYKNGIEDYDKVYVQGNLSKVFTDENGYHYSELFIKKNENDGFDSIEEAVNTTLRAGADKGVSYDDLDIFIKDIDDKEFVKLTKEEVNELYKNGGLTRNDGVEYAVSVKNKQAYDGSFSKLGTVGIFDIKNDGNFNKIKQTINNIVAKGSIFKTLVSPRASLDKDLMVAQNVAVDKAKAINDIVVNNLKSYTKLSKRQKDRVIGIINEADKSNKVLTTETMLSAGLSEKEIMAVESIKKVTDYKFFYDNKKASIDLAKKGKYIIQTDGFRDFGKRLERPSDGVYYNPKTNKTEKLTKEQIDKYNELGYSFAKLDDAIKTDAGYVDRVMLKIDNTSEIRKVKEGDQVLNYRESYLPRVYEGDYFVYKNVDINGSKKRVIVANFVNSDKMKKFIDAKNAENDGAFYDYKVKDEIIKGFDNKTEEITPSLAKKHRGKKIEIVDDYSTKSNSLDIDQVNFFIKSLNSTNRSASLHHLLEKQKEAFVNQFKDILKYNKFPDSIDEILTSKINSKRVDDAKALYRQISHIETGFKADLLDRTVSKALYNLAEVFDKGGDKTSALSNITRILGDQKVSSTFKKAAFVEFIALAPARQIMLGLLQITTLAGIASKYKNPVRLYSDIRTLQKGSNALLTKNSKEFEKIIEQNYKRFGSKNDLRTIIEGFYKSGLRQSAKSNSLNSIMHNGFIENKRISNNVIAKTLGGVSKPMSALVELFSKGYEIGESINLTGSYLIMLERALKNKKVSAMSENDFAKIHDDTRAVSLNLNETDALTYQSGSIGAFTQFMQIFHKQLSLLTTGNKVLTKGELAKIHATLIAIYGAQTYSYKFNRDEFPEELKPVADIINRGSVNAILGYLDYDMVDLKSVSPVGGSFVDTVLYKTLSSGIADISNVPSIGAVSNVINAVYNSYNETKAVIQSDIEMSPEDFIIMLTTTLSKSVPELTRYIKAYVEFNTGAVINSNGDKVTEGSGLGAILSIFGIKSQKYNDFYDSKYFDFKNNPSSYKKDSLRELMKALSYSEAVRDAIKYNSLNKESDKYMNRVVDMTKIIKQFAISHNIEKNDLEKIVKDIHDMQYDIYLRDLKNDVSIKEEYDKEMISKYYTKEYQIKNAIEYLQNGMNQTFNSLNKSERDDIINSLNDNLENIGKNREYLKKQINNEE